VLLRTDEMVDHYRVMQLIGRGGMGEVYQARDTKLGRKVALKVIRARRLSASGVLERFLYEARVTARFAHPNIVTVYGVGTHKHSPYVVLEFLEGQSLRERLRGGPIAMPEAIRHGAAVADALSEAHRRQLVHRDLKPENIFLSADGRLRVLDFGLARVMDTVDSDAAMGLESLPPELAQPKTMPGTLTGTPAYMAPEQWLSQPPTAQTDVWALGYVLHEMLSGARPYAVLPPGHLMAQVLAAVPVPLQLPPSTPEALRGLVGQCLAKNPTARPSASEVFATLRGVEAALAATPSRPSNLRVSLPPMSGFETLGRYVLLEKLATGGMGEVFRGAVVGSSGFSKQVAVKRILPSLAGEREFVNMIVDEARIASTLSHPNIAQVLDLDVEEGTPFIVMEYVPGKSMAHVVQAAQKMGRMLPAGFCFHVVEHALLGLHHAHTRVSAAGSSLGIIHRDISPQNILVSFDGAVKLTDFGVAKALHRTTQTAFGVMKGKPGYMSPEQLRGKPADVPSDLYAMGVVLHEALSLKRLRAERDVALLVKTALDNVPPLADLGVHIPQEAAHLVLRALARDPNARFSSAQQFSAELERVRGALGWTWGTAQTADLMEALFPSEPAQERTRQARFSALLTPSADAAVQHTSAQTSDPTLVDLRPPQHTPAFTSGAVTEPAPAAAPQQTRPARARYDKHLVGAGLLAALTAVSLVAWLKQPSTAPLAEVPPFQPRLTEPRVAPAMEISSRLPSPPPADVSVDLKRQPPAEERAAQSAPPPQRIRAAPPARRTRPGMVTLHSTPWTRIYIDGKDTGLFTPARDIPLAAGKHTLELRNPEMSVHWKWQVDLKPGQALSFNREQP
jgi:serine/threonine-protein kinase